MEKEIIDRLRKNLYYKRYNTELSNLVDEEKYDLIIQMIRELVKEVSDDTQAQLYEEFLEYVESKVDGKDGADELYEEILNQFQYLNYEEYEDEDEDTLFRTRSRSPTPSPRVAPRSRLPTRSRSPTPSPRVAPRSRLPTRSRSPTPSPRVAPRSRSPAPSPRAAPHSPTPRAAPRSRSPAPSPRAAPRAAPSPRAAPRSPTPSPRQNTEKSSESPSPHIKKIKKSSKSVPKKIQELIRCSQSKRQKCADEGKICNPLSGRCKKDDVSKKSPKKKQEKKCRKKDKWLQEGKDCGWLRQVMMVVS